MQRWAAQSQVSLVMTGAAVQTPMSDVVMSALAQVQSFPVLVQAPSREMLPPPLPLLPLPAPARSVPPLS